MGASRSYMKGVKWLSRINPEQGDKREADIKSFPERSLNKGAPNTAKFEHGPETEQNCTVAKGGRDY